MNRSIKTAIAGLNRITWIAVALAVAIVPTQAHAGVKAMAAGSGRTLTIVGDGEANEIAVLLDGSAIEVSAGGVPVGSFAAAPVQTVKIRLGGGSDSLSVQLASGGALGVRMLNVNLGAGDDFAAIHADPAVAAIVVGASGEDTVSSQGSTDGYSSVENVMTWTALVNNGGGPSGGLGFSCTNGECTCDKSIENDCEDMTAVCTDATVDGVITCINGWLTTHCTCTKALVVGNPGGGGVFQPIDGGALSR